MNMVKPYISVYEMINGFKKWSKFNNLVPGSARVLAWIAQWMQVHKISLYDIVYDKNCKNNAIET